MELTLNKVTQSPENVCHFHFVIGKFSSKEFHQSSYTVVSDLIQKVVEQGVELSMLYLFSYVLSGGALCMELLTPQV